MTCEFCFVCMRVPHDVANSCSCCNARLLSTQDCCQALLIKQRLAISAYQSYPPYSAMSQPCDLFGAHELGFIHARYANLVVRMKALENRLEVMESKVEKQEYLEKQIGFSESQIGQQDIRLHALVLRVSTLCSESAELIVKMKDMKRQYLSLVSQIVKESGLKMSSSTSSSAIAGDAVIWNPKTSID